MRVLFLLFLFFLPSVSYSFSPSQRMKEVAVGGAAAGLAGTPAGAAASAAISVGMDALARNGQEQAAADQAAADALKKLATDAASSSVPDPAHPVKEVYCCGPYGYNTAACAYRYNVLHDGSCGVQIDPAFIEPTSAADVLAKQAAADTAQATATAHKSAADTLTAASDAITGRSTNTSPVAPKGAGVDLTKSGSGTGSKDYIGSDGVDLSKKPTSGVDLSKPQVPVGSVPVLYPDGSPVLDPDGNPEYVAPYRKGQPPPTVPCLPNDPRVSCQVGEYTKTSPTPTPPTGTPPAPSTGTGTGTDCGCCDASDPAYGGSAKQVEALRGEQAKDRLLAEERLSKLSRFFNNKRVGFDNGVIDGDYQSKRIYCAGTFCSYSFCDIPANLKDSLCVLYQDQDKFFKKIIDYGTVASTPRTCPTFSLDFGLFGVQAINVHCVILDAISSKIALTMTFLSLFIGFRIVSSA